MRHTQQRPLGAKWQGWGGMDTQEEGGEPLAILKVPGCRNKSNGGLRWGEWGREDTSCHDPKLFTTKGMHSRELIYVK